MKLSISIHFFVLVLVLVAGCDFIKQDDTESHSQQLEDGMVEVRYEIESDGNFIAYALDEDSLDINYSGKFSREVVTIREEGVGLVILRVGPKHDASYATGRIIIDGKEVASVTSTEPWLELGAFGWLPPGDSIEVGYRFVSEINTDARIKDPSGSMVYLPRNPEHFLFDVDENRSYRVKSGFMPRMTFESDFAEAKNDFECVRAWIYRIVNKRLFMVAGTAYCLSTPVRDLDLLVLKRDFETPIE